MTNIQIEVDRLYDNLPLGWVDDPVLGYRFCNGDEPIEVHKERACRALRAREWAKAHCPPDLPPLPLGDAIQRMKHGWDLLHLYAYFARSVTARDYDVTGHPHFDIYAQGVFGSQFCPPLLRDNQALMERFPPQYVSGINSGLVWEPPETHAKAMVDYWQHQLLKHRITRNAA
jgi:hypothetical protein